jgi:hypothetical protein
MWKRGWLIRKEEKYKNKRKQIKIILLHHLHSFIVQKAAISSNKSCIKIDFINDEDIGEEVKI